jgi:hypothetical protein
MELLLLNGFSQPLFWQANACALNDKYSSYQ